MFKKLFKRGKKERETKPLLWQSWVHRYLVGNEFVGCQYEAHWSRYSHHDFEYGLLFRVVVENIIQPLKWGNWGLERWVTWPRSRTRQAVSGGACSDLVLLWSFPAWQHGECRASGWAKHTDDNPTLGAARRLGERLSNPAGVRSPARSI